MDPQGYKKPSGPQPSLPGKEHDLPIVGHADWRRELRKTILSRVLPRLSQIGRDADAAAEAPVALTDAQVSAFSEMVLAAAVPGLIREDPARPVSGEQHIFGLSVVAAFFRCAGWSVTFEPRIAFDDLLALVRAECFTAISLSVANDKFLSAFPAQVEALRRASLNGNVTLLAGGPAFLLDPDLHKRVGVDAVACDATEAVQMAEALSGQTNGARAARLALSPKSEASHFPNTPLS